jgi:hypothetical protein
LPGTDERTKAQIVSRAIIERGKKSIIIIEWKKSSVGS